MFGVDRVQTIDRESDGDAVRGRVGQPQAVARSPHCLDVDRTSVVVLRPRYIIDENVDGEARGAFRKQLTGSESKNKQCHAQQDHSVSHFHPPWDETLELGKRNREVGGGSGERSRSAGALAAAYQLLIDVPVNQRSGPARLRLPRETATRAMRGLSACEQRQKPDREQADGNDDRPRGKSPLMGKRAALRASYLSHIVSLKVVRDMSEHEAGEP